MTRFICEWTENTRQRCVIEAESEEAIQAEWDQQYESATVDAIEAMGSEVDGGIDWDSFDITLVSDDYPADLTIEPEEGD